MNANKITNIGCLSYALGDGNESIKAYGDLDDNVYITASDASLL